MRTATGPFLPLGRSAGVPSPSVESGQRRIAFAEQFARARERETNGALLTV
jgi:hypothetical protein